MAGRILIKKQDLNLKMMLEGGQSFRWKETGSAEWTGVMAGLLWIIKQFDNHIEYTTFGDKSSLCKKINGLNEARKTSEKNKKKCENLDEVLVDYLRLNHDLNKYYEEWSEKDIHFNKISKEFYGIRILNQDPVENLFSFICSSNNNIKRITGMIEKLCELYGKKIIDMNGSSYYSFPLVSTLTQSCVEGKLRNAGFGYRAKFIYQSAIMLQNVGGADFLNSLKSDTYESAKNHLIKFPGIGAKVADCICLMSLGHLEAVPVDTHVFKIASETYLPHLKKVKSVTTKIYDEIGNHFRELYGPMAGWAHAVLFCADLKSVGNGTQKTSNSNRKRKTNETLENKCTDETMCEDNIEIEKGTINCSRENLHLRITFNSGQTYRWQEIKTDVWRGVYHNRVWTLNQTDDKIDFISMRSVQTGPNVKKSSFQQVSAKQILSEFFRLDFPLSDYYKRWAIADKHFRDVATQFYGLRMIRQDIVENLFCFICSSNNTISRMRNMIEVLCKLYGDEIITLDGQVYYDFPSVTKLNKDSVEKDLRSSNFGFRAPYVRDSARYIIEHGNHLWFQNLQALSYENAKSELMKLPGIGAKVADCICLTALDHLNAIPVDTHVYHIATKYYLPHLRKINHTNKKSQTVTVRAYQEIGDCFRELFGDFAGWAHTVLFCADLRQHADLKSLE